jgi:hypothetical protein
LISDGRVAVVEFVVGALLTGAVALEDGTSVTDATVYCFGPMDGTSSATRAEAPIDATGRYAIRWLAPGSHDVCVRGAGIATGFVRVQVGPEPAASVSLRFGRPAVLGRVKHERVSNVHVSLESREPGYAFSAAVAEDGSFAFYAIRPQEYVLSAHEQGYDLEGTRTLAVKAGDRLTGIELTLAPRAYGDVEVEIVDARGAFAEFVQFYVDDTSIAPAPVGPGRYRFKAQSGRRKVTVQWFSNGSKQVAVEVDVPKDAVAYRTVRLGE